VGERKYLGEVKSFEFSSFGSAPVESSEFKFVDLKVMKNVEGNVLGAENENARLAGFSISADVRLQRGLDEHEQNRQEEKIKNLVDEKYVTVREQGFKEGHQEGLVVGKSDIETKYAEFYEKSLAELSSLINFVKEQQTKMINEHRNDVMRILEVATKWVLLREVDLKYTERLITAMLSKIQGEQYLVMKVDLKTFSEHQQIQEMVHSRFPSFKNFRIECDEQLKHPSVIVETESSLLDGSWDSQMASIEKLFSEIKAL